MKVGGPLRGCNRAYRISLEYCISYFVIQAAVIIVVGPFLIGWATAGLFLGLFLTTVLILLTSFVANILLARIFRFRTWRNETWRPWTAGALGLVLTTGGMILVGLFGGGPPRFLRDLAGEYGVILFVVGWFVLFSNLALLVAWILPSRKR